MSLFDRISKLLSDLSAHREDVDLSAIAALFTEVRDTVSAGIGTAGTVEQSAAIKKLENDLKSFSGLFDHLKNVLAGKINIVYKDSRLRESILADLTSDTLSIGAFLKMQEQIEYQFNTAWFPEPRKIDVAKNHVFIPANHKSGGIPWRHV